MMDLIVSVRDVTETSQQIQKLFPSPKNRKIM